MSSGGQHQVHEELLALPAAHAQHRSRRADHQYVSQQVKPESTVDNNDSTTITQSDRACNNIVIVRAGWVTVRGRFFMVNGANVSCACSRSPMGFSPHCHVGDGCVDVILIRHTSLINNVRLLLRLSSKRRTLVLGPICLLINFQISPFDLAERSPTVGSSKLIRTVLVHAVRPAVRRGLPCERIHIPCPVDAAVRERAYGDTRQLPAQRLELRRRGDRQRRREDQVRRARSGHGHVVDARARRACIGTVSRPLRR